MIYLFIKGKLWKLKDLGVYFLLHLIDGRIPGGLPLRLSALPLRLNEPRYASLPNIMKAKKKPLDEKTAEDYGVDVSPRLEIVSTGEPAARAAGEIVPDVDTLVAKLKEKGIV